MTYLRAWVTLVETLVGILINTMGFNGVGQRNLEGRMLLQFSPEKELCVSWFKREDRGR